MNSHRIASIRIFASTLSVTRQTSFETWRMLTIVLVSRRKLLYISVVYNSKSCPATNSFQGVTQLRKLSLWGFFHDGCRTARYYCTAHDNRSG
jgi:hypothetical protein